MDTNHPPGEDDLNINPFQKTPCGSDTVTVKLNEFKKVLVMLSAMGYFIETNTTTLLLVEHPLFTTEPCVKKAEVIRDINAKRFFRVFHVGRNRVL